MWCAVGTMGVVILFVNDDGEAVTECRTIHQVLTYYLIPELQQRQIDVGNFGFNKMRPLSTARCSMETLSTLFPGCIISRFGDVLWPPQSQDLTPSVLL